MCMGCKGRLCNILVSLRKYLEYLKYRNTDTDFEHRTIGLKNLRNPFAYFIISEIFRKFCYQNLNKTLQVLNAQFKFQCRTMLWFQLQDFGSPDSSRPTILSLYIFRWIVHSGCGFRLLGSLGIKKWPNHKLLNMKRSQAETYFFKWRCSAQGRITCQTRKAVA